MFNSSSTIDGIQGATLCKAAMGSRYSKCRRLVKGHPHPHRSQCTLAPVGTVVVSPLPPRQTSNLPHFSPSRHHLQLLTQGARPLSLAEVLWHRTHYLQVVKKPWAVMIPLQHHMQQISPRVIGWASSLNRKAGVAVNGQETRPRCKNSASRLQT